MMSRVLPVVVAVVLGLFAGAAHATVGGKETVELLGYEPVDGKVYWLEHSGGESGDLPWLLYLDLKSDRPDVRHKVKSWYRGDDADDTFWDRLEELKKRLQTMPTLPLGEFVIEVHARKVGDWYECEDCGDLPVPHYQASVTVKRRVDGMRGAVEVEAYHSHKVRVLAAHQAQSGHVVVLLSYTGIPIEGGYEEQRVLLLRSEYEQSVLKWREERVGNLKKEGGWLSLEGLFWLKEGANTLGSAKDRDIVLPAHAPAHWGALILKDREPRLKLEKGVTASCDGEPVTEKVLRSDADPAVPADRVSMPPFTFVIIVRGGKHALRLFDMKAKTLREFKGIDYYPMDPAWRINARFEAYAEPRTVEVSTAISTTEKVTVPGEFHFEVGGQSYTLQPMSHAGVEELYLLFGDRTNGKGSYGGGRFLEVPAPKEGKAILDFNRAYNPPCYFTDFATCPLPWKGNRLPVPVAAGEKAD